MACIAARVSDKRVLKLIRPFPNRFKELRQRGLPKFHAAVAAGSPTGFWRMSGHPAVQQALRLYLPARLNPIEPPWYGPVCPVVWEGRRREASPYPDRHTAIVGEEGSSASSSWLRAATSEPNRNSSYRSPLE
jgi:hypothetical protein